MAEQKENKTAKVSGKKNIGNDKKRLLTRIRFWIKWRRRALRLIT